jgi:hypothetical protein
MNPPVVTEAHFTEMIGANTPTVGHVTNVLREFMRVYSLNQRIYLANQGNLAPGAITGIVRLSTNAGNGAYAVWQNVEAQVTADFDAQKAARAVNSGTLITAANLNALITDCQNIWINRCRDPYVKGYYYSYCHSNFGSHGSHGSRGRR